MNATPKMLSYLGFAAKARKLVSGGQAAELAIKKGQALLVLIEEDAADNTKKQFSDMSSYREIPFFVVGGELGRAVGHGERKIIAITDAGFAAAVKKEINLNLGGKE